jgi:hypothetical protein
VELESLILAAIPDGDPGRIKRQSNINELDRQPGLIPRLGSKGIYPELTTRQAAQFHRRRAGNPNIEIHDHAPNGSV